MSKVSNRKKILLSIIILFFTIALISFLYCVKVEINENANFKKGIEALNNDNFEEAINYLENSDTTESAILIESIIHYQKALAAFKDRNFESAYEETKLIPESYPEYDKVAKLQKRSLKHITDEILDTAKEYFAGKEYINANNKLKLVFRYDPNNEEALQLKDIYEEKANEMQAQLEKGGFFLVDSDSIKQREKVNISEWNAAGYTGKGLTIFHDDTGNTEHSINCGNILQTILPDARILRGSIGGTIDKNGVIEAYVTCYTTDDLNMPFDEFIEKYNVTLINNSTASGTTEVNLKWASWMREKMKRYNLIGFGAAGNEGEMTNKYYGAFIMVSGVYLQSDGSISGYRTSEDADFSMFMGYQSGTSYASPFLCGMAGLLRSKDADITQEQVYQYFQIHCMGLGEEGKDPAYGWGLPILGSPTD